MISDVPEQYKIPKVFPTSQTYVNRTFATKSFWLLHKSFQEGVRPGLVISVVGLAR